MTIILLKDCKVCLQLIQTSELAWKYMLSDWRVALHTGRGSKFLWEKKQRQQRKQEQPTATTFWSWFTCNSRLIPAGWLFICQWFPSDTGRLPLWNIYSLTIHCKYTREIILWILLKLLFYVAMTLRQRKANTFVERKSVALYALVFVLIS